VRCIVTSAVKLEEMFMPQRDEPALVWDRPEPPERPALTPLSREKIVRTAIALADAEGLPAVSLRKVAAELDAGPMRLYGYLSTKEELLDLMVDEVYGEMMADEPLYGSWQRVLREAAHRLRAAALRHEWFVDLIGGRPQLGPNSLAHLESVLSAVDGAPGFEQIDTAMLAMHTVNSYAIGALRGEITERRADRQSGTTKRQWQAATGPYLMRLLKTGKFPTLNRVVADATHPGPAETFTAGLLTVLAGIEARLAK
jgi:AcrR family transcriptional regulator